MAEKIQLSKKDRLSVAWRHQFLQGSWNYERMQNGGWCYSIIPAIKKLYKDPQDRADALKRHLEFYNTHPYVSAPVMGVTLALEEERANGAEINNQAIQGVKVGMMGPLAGVGDPLFAGRTPCGERLKGGGLSEPSPPGGAGEPSLPVRRASEGALRCLLPQRSRLHLHL